MAYHDMKLMNHEKERAKKNTIIMIFIIEAFWIIILGGTNAWPLIIFTSLFFVIGPLIYYSAKKKKLASRFKRLSLLGLISNSLRNSSYRIDLFLDTRSKTFDQFVYKTTRSPYSNSQKKYHYQTFLSLDTNLKNMNQNIDGVKLKIDSFLKTKTKSGGVIREILTIKIKLYFRIGHSLSGNHYSQILDQLNFEMATRYKYQIFITFPDPSNDIMCFKLKLISPIAEFVPTSIPPLIQDFYNDIQRAYTHIVNRPLLPLKKGTKIPEKVDLSSIAKNADMVSMATNASYSYSRNIADNNIDLITILDKIKISLDEYTQNQDGDTIIVNYRPKFNYFSEVTFYISDVIQMEFISSDQVRKILNFSIDIVADKLVFLVDSEKPNEDLLNKYRIRQFIDAATHPNYFESVIVKTSEDFRPTIMLNLPTVDYSLLEDGVNFAKSLLQEMKFIY